MRPLRYSINLTLDGCCDHRAITPYEEVHHHATQQIAQADALIFGRVTYQMMESAFRPPELVEALPAWMHAFAHTIHAAKKYVASSTLAHVDWNSELVGGNLAESIRELKSQPGNGLYVGGVTLPRALTELGLIDEYEFLVHPRLAGRGPTIFTGLSSAVDLELVQQVAFSSGAVALTYRRQTLGEGRKSS